MYIGVDRVRRACRAAMRLGHPERRQCMVQGLGFRV